MWLWMKKLFALTVNININEMKFQKQYPQENIYVFLAVANGFQNIQIMVANLGVLVSIKEPKHFSNAIG
jgi:hypothetical protein